MHYNILMAFLFSFLCWAKDFLQDPLRRDVFFLEFNFFLNLILVLLKAIILRLLKDF